MKKTIFILFIIATNPYTLQAMESMAIDKEQPTSCSICMDDEKDTQELGKTRCCNNFLCFKCEHTMAATRKRHLRDLGYTDNIIQVCLTCPFCRYTSKDATLIKPPASEQTLRLIKIITDTLENFKGLKDKNLVDTIVEKLFAETNRMSDEDRTQSYINLLKEADYFNFTTLYQVIMRSMAQVTLNNSSVEKLMLQQLQGQKTQIELARWRYLLTGIPAQEEIQKNLGFSLRELLDYNRLNKAIYNLSISKELNLSGLQLINLDGLQTIPSIKTCVRLILRDNQLKELPADVFIGFDQLKALYLDFNQLKELAPRSFASLTQLKDLNLADNQLTELPVDLFTDLPQLSYLNLNFNEIKELPANIFNGLIRLKILYLNRNKLDSLHSNIFTELIELEQLYLSHNKLKNLPQDIFIHPIKLAKLYLGNNQLRTLPASIFSHLTHLKELFLKGNYFNKESRNTIQAMLPTDIEIFW